MYDYLTSSRARADRSREKAERSNGKLMKVTSAPCSRRAITPVTPPKIGDPMLKSGCLGAFVGLLLAPVLLPYYVLKGLLGK